ncbi:unnamed protein product [Ectocarpus sp. 12 AP-2014]
MASGTSPWTTASDKLPAAPNQAQQISFKCSHLRWMSRGTTARA